MSPSIGELFPSGDGETNDTPFDASIFDQSIDQLLRDRPIPGAPEGYQVEPPPTPSGETGVRGGESAPAAPSVASTPPEAPPSSPPFEPANAPGMGVETPPAPTTTGPAADPFAALTDLERLELLQARQALLDPERQLAVRRAMLGIPDVAAAASPPVVAAPEPALPEHIDPESIEAQMWHMQRTHERQLDELRQEIRANTTATEQDRAMAAARSATQAFANRYGEALSPEEISWVAQTAGMQKLPEAFMSTGMSVEDAMVKSLDFTLRSNDSLLAKILGPAAPPAPTPSPGESPEADARKRQLTALSSAAAPTGEAPQRVPLTHREDGKLSEDSRLQLVREMTGGGVMGELMGPNT